MSFSCILYPAVGSSCTQLLGSIVPCPLGRPPTHSLGTIVLLRWVQLYPFAGYKTDYEQARGLLKRLRPEPVAAAVEGHVDATTGEVQVVRVATDPCGSTRRPIVANDANVDQLTREVVTQGGQVEVVVCIGSGRKGIRYGPGVIVSICTPICAVYCGVRVVSAYL